MLSKRKSLQQYPSPKEEFEPQIDYLKLLLTSREADNREGVLFRQGRGFLCTPSAGHENLAALVYAIEETDPIFCHYRDRAILLARGVDLRNIALDFFAKKDSSSGGRQMAGHYSAPEKNVISCASPIGSECLPATGAAWAAKMQGNKKIVICCIGDAGLRQGEFYEAYCFAVQENLPIIFVVEDNGYGISTPTDNMNPLRLEIFSQERILRVNGRVPEEVYINSKIAADRAREGDGPSILWLSFDRLLSHTSSDNQSLYRKATDLSQCIAQDPITTLRDRLYQEGHLDERRWNSLVDEVQADVLAAYTSAEQAENPDVQNLYADIMGENTKSRRAITFLNDVPQISYADALNKSLRHLLDTDHRVIMFGEDIEDPKGGVFGLTKGLSSSFPGRVVNAPLAEATICGTAVGLSLAGYLPIFEIQFIDFISTGLNQLINQAATMRWRTAGKLKCPLILLAPCGGYVQGAGPWHTQTNESMFAHVPGLRVYMPGTALDVANTVINCAAGEDPALILLPKKQFFQEFSATSVPDLHHDSAKILKEGSDVTIVTWGNCTSLSMQAAATLSADNITAEVIDLRSITPCDMPTIKSSLAKTGRLVVVHEDNRTCGFGQSIISQIVSSKESWDMLYAPPQLVCREDALIPFNPAMASAILPKVDHIIQAARSIMD
ncbi:MAG: transketolase [Alphaproteobacteria bacterium]|nr:transketolase [Alphaproteobacteria bacterium]